MDGEQLLTFMTVFELNNYSRAADHLNLTQPAVTARIQKLETELGCKLFYRDGKKILLTEEGTSLLPYARKILSYMNEAKQTIELLKTPTLAIGLSPAISVSIVLEVLSLLRDKGELWFDIVEAEDSVEVSKMIEEGLIDIGLVRDVIPFTNLESKYIYHEKLVFIVGKDLPLATKVEIKKDDLINQTMICYRRETAYGEISMKN
ncbi:LysR family transcriptional regulator [Aneurinibacillus tyrosinisolvens]|uniref:LysR family transcriptional regulator n=1 Tax=Aneurinibacillus tyrosinisolvens TaxID=1443435 RepID=UPI00069B32F2|nr:LysR family transcriptional regulator [Aneurinibacillus tyrosinisolvens]